jgi:hypothetical protein
MLKNNDAEGFLSEEQEKSRLLYVSVGMATVCSFALLHDATLWKMEFKLCNYK